MSNILYDLVSLSVRTYVCMATCSLQWNDTHLLCLDNGLVIMFMVIVPGSQLVRIHRFWGETKPINVGCGRACGSPTAESWSILQYLISVDST